MVIMAYIFEDGMLEMNMECIKLREYGIINDGIYDEKEGIF